MNRIIKVLTNNFNALKMICGKVIEMGTHSELLKNNGLYSQMYRMQQDNYK